MILYAGLESGASGDMLLAALADAGAASVITTAVRSVGCDVTFSAASRAGMGCLVADVSGTDRRMSVAQMRAALEAWPVAARALELLLAAEVRVHRGGEPHLHEMGSADTVADMAGFAAGIDALRVTRVAAAPVPMPRGWVPSHGATIPIPAPAVVELLAGVPVYGVDTTRELVTPTAAALLRAVDCTFGPMPAMTLRGTGVGGGGRDIDGRPNVCRVFVGGGSPQADTLVILEANIDDDTPERLAYAVEQLLAAGALDAWITPIVMKKGRPAFQVSALCPTSKEVELRDLLLRETSTFGVRRVTVDRTCLDREIRTVEVEACTVRVKVGLLDGRVVRTSPEFEDCRAAAAALGRPIAQIYEAATAAIRRQPA